MANLNLQHMVDTRVQTPDDRERLARHYESGLVLLRAQGLEPDAFAKEMRDRVLAGEISVEESIDLTRQRILDDTARRRGHRPSE